MSLTVADTGCGMSDEIHRRSFEPFFTTKGTGKGTGLGLSVVDGIVAQHHGWLEVESSPGRGTIMRVRLPSTDAAIRQADSPVLSCPPEGGETILVLDDSPLVLTTLTKILRSLGYKLLVADSPQTAIDLAADHDGRIDLLLTDVVMPNMSGAQVAAALRSKRPELKVVYISGYAIDHIDELGSSADHADFISKPFRSTTLSGTLRRVLSD